VLCSTPLGRPVEPDVYLQNSRRHSMSGPVPHSMAGEVTSTPKRTEDAHDDWCVLSMDSVCSTSCR